jgi:hypothetical protein
MIELVLSSKHYDEMTGRIKAILVDEGDFVTAGHYHHLPTRGPYAPGAGQKSVSDTLRFLTAKAQGTQSSSSPDTRPHRAAQSPSQALNGSRTK